MTFSGTVYLHSMFWTEELEEVCASSWMKMGPEGSESNTLYMYHLFLGGGGDQTRSSGQLLVLLIIEEDAMFFELFDIL